MNNERAFQIAFQLGGNIDPSFRQAFATANEALGNTEQRTESLSHSTESLQTGMSLSSKAAIAAGGAIAAVGVGLGAAVISADQYSNAMKQVEAGTGATAEEMKEIKEISKNLYNKNLGEDWNDLAQAIQSVKSVTDLSGKSLETATKYAIQYRDVFGEDIAESIKASDTMMKNFGITADQSYNLLAQGAQRGLNKSQELLDSANEYSVYFKTLGYDANEMFDIFNAGLENGAFNLLIWALWWRHHIETSLIHGKHLTLMTRAIMSEALEKERATTIGETPSTRKRVEIGGDSLSL